MTQTKGVLLGLVIACAGCAHTEQDRSAGDHVVRTENEDMLPMSEQETQVRRQVEDHWLMDVGTPGLEKFIVEIVVEMNPDGSVQSAKIDHPHHNGDPNWREFAESCLRAVWKSSPLRMPANKPYEPWKQMRLVFYGREMAQ